MSATHIFLDIETIPDQREGAASAARSRISAPSNYKDPAKIEAFIAERAEEAWLQTALDGSYGEAFCIGYALGDGPTQVLMREDLTPEGERVLLQKFSDVLARHTTMQPIWVGHNVLKFDLRFLWRRHIIQQVKPARRIPRDVSAWSPEVYDTMLAWSGDRNSYVSLRELLSILRIESEDGITGADVWDLVKAGDHDPVVEHCHCNVEDVRLLWQRMEMRNLTAF